MKYLKQLPVQLILSIILAFLSGSVLDVFYVSLFYSFSSCFISALIFVLPVMIFSFIFQSLMNNSRVSLSLILFIFAGVTFSNCISVIIAYFFGQTFLPFFSFNPSSDVIDQFTSRVELLFSLQFPSFIGSEKALLLGLSCGIAMSFLQEEQPLKKIVQKGGSFLSKYVDLFLRKIFMPLLPLYVFGFCLKLSFDHALVNLFEQFGKVFLLSLSLVLSYLFVLYMIGSGGDLKKICTNIGAMLPAGLMGFSTMSSAVTMPLTIDCTEKITADSSFARLIIPSTANIHMLGDNLILVVFSMALLVFFGMPWPDLYLLLPFAVAFSLAKLSCVGVPGASVLVILPVVQNYLGFSAEMLSLLTTIYILQDSFGTASNVMANGAFALIIQRLFARVNKFDTLEIESI